jgi:DNA-directed RNA polymerase subunit delta
MNKEDLELLSNKDIAKMILEENGKTENTAELFKKIISLLELPESVFENKIADFYTALATDKRFILLDNGQWDLRSNHTSDKLIKVSEDDDEDEDEETEKEESEEDELDEDNFDDTDDEDYDEDTNEELKDLVVIDEDELELEV